MPPAKNTSAPQTYSTSTCSTNYRHSKPTSWFHSLTNRLKMLVPHSQCFEVVFTSINKIAPKHIYTQNRIIYPLQTSHYYVGYSKVSTTLDTYLFNLVVTLSVPRLISPGYSCRVQGKVHHYLQMNKNYMQELNYHSLCLITYLGINYHASLIKLALISK